MQPERTAGRHDATATLQHLDLALELDPFGTRQRNGPADILELDVRLEGPALAPRQKSERSKSGMIRWLTRQLHQRFNDSWNLLGTCNQEPVPALAVRSKPGEAIVFHRNGP